MYPLYSGEPMSQIGVLLYRLALQKHGDQRQDLINFLLHTGLILTTQEYGIFYLGIKDFRNI